MTSWKLCVVLLLAGAQAQDPAPCPLPCVPLQSCSELAGLKRPGHSEPPALQAARAKCGGEHNMVCCPSDSSEEKSSAEDDSGEGAVGTRRLGFGGNDRHRQFGLGLINWPALQNPFGPSWGPSPSAQRPSWGSEPYRPRPPPHNPYDTDHRPPPHNPYDPDHRPPPNPNPFDSNRRPPQIPPLTDSNRQPIRNPYDVPPRPAIDEFTTSSTTRRPNNQGNRRTTTHRPNVDRDDNLFPNDVCGHTNDDRIFGGNMSSLFELPWMARLGYTSRQSRRVSYRCGGALINNRYVLTAAHCVGDGSDPVQVRLGELDEDSEIDCQEISGERVCGPKVVDVDIAKVIRHPEYSSDPSSANYLQNDIALLRLKNSVKFTEAVKPICLPQGDVPNFAGKNAMVAGWGRDRNDKSGGTRFLMKAAVPVVENSECARVYRRRDVSVDSRTQLCAGGEKGVDSCQGDSGGPLYRAGVVNGEPRLVQYGVVSFGLQRCGEEGVPGVYTRVQHFMPWIRANVKA